MQLKELLNLWIEIFSFHVKMYMNKLLFSTKHYEYILKLHTKQIKYS